MNTESEDGINPEDVARPTFWETFFHLFRHQWEWMPSKERTLTRVDVGGRELYTFVERFQVGTCEVCGQEKERVTFTNRRAWA